jgi:hypothetical protein
VAYIKVAIHGDPPGSVNPSRLRAATNEPAEEGRRDGARRGGGGERRHQEEGFGHFRDRLYQARGGQDHGHRVAGEVPAGAHQGRRRQGREPWRLHHRLPREDQGHRHLRGALLEEVCDSHLPKPVLIVVMNNA